MLFSAVLELGAPRTLSILSHNLFSKLILSFAWSHWIPQQISLHLPPAQLQEEPTTKFLLMRQWMITNIYITLLTSKTQETRWEREPTFKSVRPRVISSRPWMSWAEKTPRYSSKSRECSHLDTSSTDHWDTRHKHQSHNNSLTPDMHIELTPNTLY